MADSDKLTTAALLPLIEHLRPLAATCALRWAPVFALMGWHQDQGRCPTVPELRRSIDRIIDGLAAMAAPGDVHGGSVQEGYVRGYVSRDADTGAFQAGIELIGERHEA